MSQRRQRPLEVKGGNIGREMAGKFGLTSRELTLILGLFNMPQICDMGQERLLLTLRGRIIFALENPTASDGFEPANFGTKGQHATSRQPKPLSVCSLLIYL
jgi:hypothetical protein